MQRLLRRAASSAAARRAPYSSPAPEVCADGGRARGAVGLGGGAEAATYAANSRQHLAVQRAVQQRRGQQRWCGAACARTAASTSGVGTPAARCMASQPQSTSSPSGVRPSPRPTRRAGRWGLTGSSASRHRAWRGRRGPRRRAGGPRRRPRGVERGRGVPSTRSTPSRTTARSPRRRRHGGRGQPQPARGRRRRCARRGRRRSRRPPRRGRPRGRRGAGRWAVEVRGAAATERPGAAAKALTGRSAVMPAHARRGHYGLPM